jgi:hypothetical protein
MSTASSHGDEEGFEDEIEQFVQEIKSNSTPIHTRRINHHNNDSNSNSNNNSYTETRFTLNSPFKKAVIKTTVVTTKTVKKKKNRRNRKSSSPNKVHTIDDSVQTGVTDVSTHETQTDIDTSALPIEPSLIADRSSISVTTLRSPKSKISTTTSAYSSHRYQRSSRTSDTSNASHIPTYASPRREKSDLDELDEQISELLEKQEQLRSFTSTTSTRSSKRRHEVIDKEQKVFLDKMINSPMSVSPTGKKKITNTINKLMMRYAPGGSINLRQAKSSRWLKTLMNKVPCVVLLCVTVLY